MGRGRVSAGDGRARLRNRSDPGDEARHQDPHAESAPFRRRALPLPRRATLRPENGGSGKMDRDRVSARKLHLMFLCGEYPPSPHGGIGTIVQLLARRLVEVGVQVTVIGTYVGLPADEHSSDEGVAVIRLASKGSGFYALVDERRQWRFITEYSQANSVDAIEGSELAFWAAPRRTPLRVIRMHGGHRFFADAAGNPTKPLRAWLEKRSFERADGLIAVSQYVGERTFALLQVRGQVFEVIPNVADTRLFSPDPSVHRERGSVFYFGALCEKKGVRQLLQAWPSVVDARPEARLTLAGRDTKTGPDGLSYRAAVLDEVPRDVVRTIEFLGYVPHQEIPTLLSRSELCVLPSHMEAHPLAWLEVMSSGTPLIGGDVGPARETILPGVTGELVDPHDPVAIGSLIIELLADRPRRELLGSEGARAVADYTVDRCAERTVDFYNRLLGASGAAGAATPGPPTQR